MAFLLPIIGAIGAGVSAVRTISSLVSGPPAARGPAGEIGVEARLGSMTTLLQQIATELLPANITAEVRAAEVPRVAENGGSMQMDPGGPFIGGDGISSGQPIPDQPLEVPPSLRFAPSVGDWEPTRPAFEVPMGPFTTEGLEPPPLQRPFDLPTDSGGTLSLAALTAGFGNLIPEIGGIVRQLRGTVGAEVGTAIGGLARAIPSIEKVVPAWLGRVGGGAAAAAAIYELYTRLRAAGATHASARRTALGAAGIRHRRRRMRPTNVRALRRAIRRIRGARRLFSKIRGLHVGGRGSHFPRIRRRRMYRRGDLPPFLVEDTADMMDEAEDLGIDPGMFQEEEMPGDWESAS